MRSTFLLVAILFTEICTLTKGLTVSYDPSRIDKLHVDSEQNVTLSLTSDRIFTVEDASIRIVADPSYNLGAEFLPGSWNCVNLVCNRTFKVIGRFLGYGHVSVLQKNESTGPERPLPPPLEVTILREDTILNSLFIIFVATVVSINNINFGCALEMDVVRKVLQRPIGPAVGFACQFIIMPLVAYGAGYLLFDDPVLRLGLFTFGCSPGGGASNMWTVLLEGNLNLSITMTFISSIAAFGTIPLWIFTLGNTIVKDTNIVIPYRNIMTSLVSLIVPIGIGLLIQRYLPAVAARSKRFLAPVCIVLIIGIIVLASIAYTYIFFLLSWSVVFAATISVWAGFLSGILSSVAFRFPYSDVVAIAVESGIQNTGIAFVLLTYSLPHPASEIAAVMPVAASIITPIPLFVVYCCKKFRKGCFRRERLNLKSVDEDPYLSTKNIIEEGEKEGAKYTN